jgi:glycine hydroxymethyltransferase
MTFKILYLNRFKIYNKNIHMNLSLIKTDHVLASLIEAEKERQYKGIELIASENFTSKPVMECLGSILTNKYAEGLPSKRYYGGNDIIDKIENLCIERALETFNLDKNKWSCNVNHILEVLLILLFILV